MESKYSTCCPFTTDSTIEHGVYARLKLLVIQAVGYNS